MSRPGSAPASARLVHRVRHLPRTVKALFAAGLVVATLSACVPAPPTTVTTVMGGLDIPWDVGWLPNRTMLFTERGGGLNAIVNGQRRLLWKPSDLVVAIESGMMSLAVDPSYGFFNNDVFVCFASNLGGNNVRVARLSLDPNLNGIVSRTDIVSGIPMNPEGELGKHSGCRLQFGPDGYLWIGTGDAAEGAAPQ